MTTTLLINLAAAQVPAGTPSAVKVRVVLSQDGVTKGDYWQDINGQNPVPVAVDVPDATYLATVTAWAADSSQVGPTDESNVTIAHASQLVPAGVSVA